MKLSFKYPSELKLKAYLKKQSLANFNYDQQYGTRNQEVKGYDNDLNSIFLGKGEKVWNNAKVALEHWQQFPPGWTKIYKNATALEAGNTVLVLFKLFGIWWSNSARIVYTLNEEHTYGFAYGTLTGHVESGEECFWIDKDAEDHVYYHIKAFSKPDFWAAKLAYPLARVYQRKFVRESMARMKKISAIPASENVS